VFGIANEEEVRLIKPVARALLARDALRADDFGGLSFGPGARPILKGEESVSIVLPPQRERKRRAPRDFGPADPLFDALRDLRRELARQQGVPPYVIFHDATLREMAAARPHDRHGLSEITGVGARKLEEYGDAILAVIRTF